jgi:hypothetical protein
MPAVNPARLRFQIEGLMAFFQSPPEFHRRLGDLFSLYANRALRFGESMGGKPLIPMYHLPHPIFRQLELDLQPYVNENPQAALVLADELWQDTFFEVKQTAIFILGIVPIKSPDPVIQRLERWLSPELDTNLTVGLFSAGTLKLQNSYPDVWEKFIESFLREDDPERLALGIQGLTEGIKNPTFKNLPAIFRLISPIIRNPDRSIHHNLVHLIESLVQISPTETGFFLKQTLSLSNSSEAERLVKQCLPLFPENIQADLKSIRHI